MKRIKKFFKKSYYPKYALGGVLIFCFEYILTFVLTEGLSLDPRASYAIALSIGLYLIFHYHKSITFRLKHHHHIIFSKFVVFSAAGYFLNWALVSIATFWVSYLITIPTISIPLSLFGYLVNKHWTFKHKRWF